MPLVNPFHTSVPLVVQPAVVHLVVVALSQQVRVPVGSVLSNIYFSWLVITRCTMGMAWPGILNTTTSPGTIGSFQLVLNEGTLTRRGYRLDSSLAPCCRKGPRRLDTRYRRPHWGLSTMLGQSLRWWRAKRVVRWTTWLGVYFGGLEFSEFIHVGFDYLHDNIINPYGYYGYDGYFHVWDCPNKLWLIKMGNCLREF